MGWLALFTDLFKKCKGLIIKQKSPLLNFKSPIPDSLLVGAHLVLDTLEEKK